jgi:hypothetical protein
VHPYGTDTPMGNDASSLVTAAQIPAEKGYLKI